MELVEHKIQLESRSTKIRIYFSYDWHNGAFGCDHDLLEKQLNHILNDDHGYALLGGDLNECIAKKDRRHDSGAIHPRYDLDVRDKNLIGAQERYVRGLVKPLAKEKKILASLLGNHESKYASETDKNFTLDICQEFDIPYGGDNVVVVLKVGRPRSESRKTILINAIHGSRGGGTTAGKVTALERQSHRLEGAHIYIRGHGHKKVIVPDEHIEIGWTHAGKPKERKRPVLKGSSGAYLRILKPGGSCYAERAEYQSTDLGCIYAEITPFAGDGHGKDKVTMELRDLV